MKETHPGIREVDVLVLGGSLSGASLALLLRRTCPESSVTVVEKSEAFSRRVGESTSEVGGCFLTRVLRLSTYLSQEHIVKHGLRLWFQSEGNDRLQRCTEIGPFFQACLPTYQLDRARLDQHLLDTAEAAGCQVERPARATEIRLTDEGRHHVVVQPAGGEAVTYRARWVVDATGKAAVIGRRRGTVEPLAEHGTKSVWARFRGVRDLDGAELAQEDPRFAAACYVSRGSATNHLMGRGWWCWLIPLKNGDMSAGLTYDPRYFELEKSSNLTESLLTHLRRHPVGRWMFRDAEAIPHDTLAYSQLAYQNTEVAGPGWICVGDAAGFMDPLYSHGIDFIAHTVMGARRVIAADLAGNPQDSESHRQAYQHGYQKCCRRWFEALYRDKYAYLGDADLMKAAFLLDIGAYFIGPVHFVYRDTENEFAQQPYHGPIGDLVARFMSFYNRRLVRLGDRRQALGRYGTHNLDRRHLIRPGFSPGLPALRPFAKGVLAWLQCECQDLWFRLRPSQAARRPAGSTESPGRAPRERQTL